MVENYYNSGQFSHTLEALSARYDSPFRMFEELWEYYRGRGLDQVQHKRSARYEILLEFAAGKLPEEKEYFRELLTFDYYLRENAKTRPEFAGDYQVDKDTLRTFYEWEARTGTYLPDYRGYDKNQIRRMTHLEYFRWSNQYVLFDYFVKNPLNHEARICKIDMCCLEGEEHEFS